MGTDAAPDDMRFAFPHRLAVLERCPAIRRERELEDTLSSANRFHPQTSTWRAPSLEILDELPHSDLESISIVLRHPEIVGLEARCLRERRHARDHMHGSRGRNTVKR